MEGRRNIFENALCLTVRKHSFGTTKKIDKRTIQEIVDAMQRGNVEHGEEPQPIDTELLNMSKKIYDSPALKDIRKIYSAVDSYLERYTVVGAMMRPGTYVVPDDHVDRVDLFLRDRIDELRPSLERLRDEYETYMEQHLEKLGPLGSRSDYPSAQEVISKFTIEYEFLAQDVPQKLQYISRRVLESEREKAVQRMAVVSERVENILVGQTVELLDYLIERLTDQEDGKRKKFASNMVDRAKEFFDTLRTRNLTGSEQIDDLARRGQDILQGINLEALKDDGDLRSHIRQRFEEVKGAMAGMIVNAPRRALNLRRSGDAVQATPQVQGDSPTEAGLPDVCTNVGDEATVAPSTSGSGVNTLQPSPQPESDTVMAEQVRPAERLIDEAVGQVAEHILDHATDGIEAIGEEIQSLAEDSQPDFYPDEEPTLF